MASSEFFLANPYILSIFNEILNHHVEKCSAERNMLNISTNARYSLFVYHLSAQSFLFSSQKIKAKNCPIKHWRVSKMSKIKCFATSCLALYQDTRETKHFTAMHVGWHIRVVQNLPKLKNKWALHVFPFYVTILATEKNLRSLG